MSYRGTDEETLEKLLLFAKDWIWKRVPFIPGHVPRIDWYPHKAYFNTSKNKVLGHYRLQYNQIELSGNWRSNLRRNPLEIVATLFHEICHWLQHQVMPLHYHEGRETHRQVELGCDRWSYEQLGIFVSTEWDTIHPLLCKIGPRK